MKIIIKIFWALIVPVVLFGCMPPPNNNAYQPAPEYQQPEYQQPAYQQTGYQQSGYQQQNSQDFNIDGLWCFVDNHGRHVRNLIKRTPNGIYASPYGRRGRSVFVRQVAPNLFSGGGAQYLFFSDTQGRWKSPKYDWALTRCN